MAGSRKYFTRINILIGNVFVCLISGLAVGHWQDMKNRTNGVLDVLDDSEEEFFGRGMVSGPFEDSSRNSRMWMGYINEDGDVVKERIADMEKNLLKGAEEVELLTGDEKDRSGIGSGWYAQKNRKQNGETMRNWSGYLDGVRSKWYKPARVQVAHETGTDFGNEGGANDNAKINDFLKRLRTGPGKAKTAAGNCDQTDADKEIMRQMKKSLAETFVYRNITLSDINRMTKIVDFVDRYRGRMRDSGGGNRDKIGLVPAGAAAGSVITPPV